ncbi:cytochrome b/b6 domain-containing protein [Ferruginivarius sediminum]|uniref:Cytochrome b561 bacterial/Ni-hydrogenase domain-containing protein n=1 Tax=Ferruginivarius sediminum TaxID=2661937 RepID=A0A369T5C6_9PROT|nr:cytochrome b/b6 domain-containing protein [Ferruginivarius sediminum]RDD60530.1 hypothetical protein DRB17_17690 [Ferruginivarius sediminum]
MSDKRGESSVHVPGWLRLWHAGMALTVVVLTLTGLLVHFGGWVPGNGLASVVAIHEATGIAGGVIYALGLTGLAASGDWRRYLPPRRHLIGSLAEQFRYYAFRLPRQDLAKVTAREQRFNPLQQCVYLATLVVCLPVLLGTGIAFMFPQTLPKTIMGYAGLWPVAALHTLAAVFVLIFLLVHIYLAFAAAPHLASLRLMVTGHWRH